jgi:integrase
MPSLPNIKPELYRYTQNNGKKRVVLRVNYEGVDKYYKTEIEIFPEQFNKSGQLIHNRGSKKIITENSWVLSSNHHYHNYNNLLKNTIEKLMQAWRDLEALNRPITAQAIIDFAEDPIIETENNLIDFINLELQQLYAQQRRKTAQHITSQFKKLFEFLKKKITVNEQHLFTGDPLFLEEITHTRIKEFQLFLSNYITEKNTKMAPQTSNKHLQNIKMTLKKHPDYYDHIERQFRGINKLPSTITKPKPILQISDFEKIEQYIPVASGIQESRDIFLFCFYCQGIRVGEALSVKKEDIDLPNNRIRIYVEKSQHVKKVRDILLSEKARQIIETYYQNQNPYNYLFSFLKIEQQKDGSNNNEFRADVESATSLINKNLKKIGKQLNFEHLSTHVARHSFITIAVERTGDIYLTSKGVAHSSVAVTEGYSEFKVTRADELNLVYD